jgi:hypothetical protein
MPVEPGMSRLLVGSVLVGSLACTSAHADRVAAPPGPLVTSPAYDSPYEVEILDAHGSPLDTYAHRGRYYVRGDRGDRYVVHVSNPTPRRVEAVITVDGLDVIDGENGDLGKRGYVIQPYGDLRVEGFRTSHHDVATFRFSSVGASYAGRKGKARNVGVIAVAVFEENAPPPVYLPAPPMPTPYYRDDYEGARSEPAPSGGAAKGARPAAPPSAAPTTRSAPAEASADASASAGEACCGAPRRERSGLGTEFGEQRYSAVSFTRFVRSSRRPAALIELRYNDASGLAALGIPVAPMPDENELYTRETANPFPGDRQYARPPAGIY